LYIAENKMLFLLYRKFTKLRILIKIGLTDVMILI